MQSTTTSHPYLSKAENYFVCGSIFLFPILMGTVRSASSAIFILLTLVGLFLIKREWGKLYRWEKRILWGFVLFVGYQLLSITWATDQDFAWSRFEKIVRFLFAIPVYLIIRRQADHSYKALLYGLVAAGPVMAWAATQTLENGRAQGAYNHILFGDFTLLVAISALSAALLAGRQKWLNLLLVLSAGLALYASLLTQTRGAWMVLPVAVLLFLWISLKRFDGKARWIVISTVLAVAIGGIISFSQTEIFQSRFQNALHSWDAYWAGEARGSVALRFRKWEAAANHWQAEPFLGTGLGDYWHDTKQLAAENPYFAPIAQFSEAHSLYFEFLATGGVIGLALLLWSLFYQPFIAFWQHVHDRNQPIVQYLAFDGVLVIVALMNDGITQNWLSRNSLTAAYIVFIIIMLTGIARLATSPSSDIKHETVPRTV